MRSESQPAFSQPGSRTTEVKTSASLVMSVLLPKAIDLALAFLTAMASQLISRGRRSIFLSQHDGDDALSDRRI
jgi:hypothetical protein